jgi:hypothetical protein
LKYAIGWSFYEITPPISVSQASFSTTNSLKKSGNGRTGLDVIAYLSLSNALWAVLDKENALWWSKLVNGLAMIP